MANDCSLTPIESYLAVTNYCSLNPITTYLKVTKHVLQLPHEPVFRWRLAIPEVKDALSELRNHEKLPGVFRHEDRLRDAGSRGDEARATAVNKQH